MTAALKSDGHVQFFTREINNCGENNCKAGKKICRATDDLCRAKTEVLPGQNRATVGQKVTFYSQNPLGEIYNMLIIRYTKNHGPGHTQTKWPDGGIGIFDKQGLMDGWWFLRHGIWAILRDIET